MVIQSAPATHWFIVRCVYSHTAAHWIGALTLDVTLMPLHELMMIDLSRSVVSLAESSVTATARLLTEVIRAGMWKDLYCFALRIDMVLPDWRGFIGLVSWQCVYHAHMLDRSI